MPIKVFPGRLFVISSLLILAACGGSDEQDKKDKQDGDPSTGGTWSDELAAHVQKDGEEAIAYLETLTDTQIQNMRTTREHVDTALALVRSIYAAGAVKVSYAEFYEHLYGSEASPIKVYKPNVLAVELPTDQAKRAAVFELYNKHSIEQGVLPDAEDECGVDSGQAYIEW